MRKFPGHMKRHRSPGQNPKNFDQAFENNSQPFYTFDFFQGQQTLLRLYVGQRVITENREAFNKLLDNLRNDGIRHEASLEGKPKFVLDSIQAVERKILTVKRNAEALKHTWQG